jgi:NitT/TauT family transport system ATP-binding protein
MIKLEVRNVTKGFEGNNEGNSVIALENINLSMEEGEFVCFVGPSGCGKTTLLNILAGLDKPTSGDVVLNGQQVRETGPDRIMVFQENALFPWLKVIDNVEFGLNNN